MKEVTHQATDVPPARDEKYAGVSNAIEVLGKGNAYGWVGTGLGAVVGALTSGYFIHEENKYVHRITEQFEKWKIPASGKAILVLAGAFAASQIGHVIGVVIGWSKGAREAGKGHAQFERMKAQQMALEADVQSLEQENERLHKVNSEYRNYVGHALTPREKASHAAAVAARKEHAAEEGVDIAR